MSESIDHRLEELARQNQRLLELMENQSRNLMVLYRRTTALALMLEALSKQESMQVPRAIRAEIDASLRPEEFALLAKQDAEEFKSRYGEQTYQIMQERGIEAISRIGDLTSLTKPGSLQ
jgi:hypothetical protein